MKFKLLLCISLLFSMFHAAAMPISSPSMPMESEAPMVNHMSFHCDNLMQDDQKVHNCCAGAALQSTLPLRMMIGNSHKDYFLLSPRLLRHTPDVLFRPPKFYPVLTG